MTGITNTYFVSVKSTSIRFLNILPWPSSESQILQGGVTPDGRFRVRFRPNSTEDTFLSSTGSTMSVTDYQAIIDPASISWGGLYPWPSSNVTIAGISREGNGDLTVQFIPSFGTVFSTESPIQSSSTEST